MLMVMLSFFLFVKFLVKLLFMDISGIKITFYSNFIANLTGFVFNNGKYIEKRRRRDRE